MDTRLECFKILGAGVATISLVGAGTGVGIVFGSLLFSYCSKSFKLKVNCFNMQY